MAAVHVENDHEGAFCLPAPTEFKRMLSWQLSTPSTVPVKKTKKKSRDYKLCDSDTGMHNSDSDAELDCEYDYTEVVVNSDGEEEMYYSAPESPLSSDQEPDIFSSPDKLASKCTLHELTGSGRKKGKSKKQKKKVRYITRKAVAEFLAPLCDLVCEDVGAVEMGELFITSHAEVPRLVELCLRRMRKDDIESPDHLPYLLRVLLQSDRSQQSQVSIQLRWLERLLATPFQMAQVLAYNDSEKCWCLPAVLLAPEESWPTKAPDTQSGLHLPLYDFSICPDQGSMRDSVKQIMTGPFLHFINFFFPMFGNKEPSREENELLSPAQLSTIHYVNNFIKTRYKNLSKVLSGMLLLWPGYVYWARGQVKLALAAFQHALSHFECPSDHIVQGNHKAAVLNEIGRMMVQFGERELACQFIQKSERLCDSTCSSSSGLAWFPANQQLIQPSMLAMEAAAYDCGLLSLSVARNAARLWKSVLKALNSLPHSVNQYWALQLAAAESRLMVHSGVITGIDPSDPTPKDSAMPGYYHNKHFLEECMEFLNGLVDKQPFLFYHLSMVQAMLGRGESSRRSWARFAEFFIHVDWPLWLNTDTFNSKFHMFNTLLPANWYPWEPLVELLASSLLKQAPVLKVCWRTRLLHPRYPYFFEDKTASFLADHCSQAIGIRLTQDGFITADWHMDTPPMRAVLLNPYTGELCFPRDVSSSHVYLHSLEVELDNPLTKGRNKDRAFLPWPVRVFENESCVVELTMVSTRNNLSKYCEVFGNHSATLCHYSCNGGSIKLDLRKMIRKRLKEVILQKLQDSELSEKGPVLNKLFESGGFVGFSEFRKKSQQPRYIKWTSSETKQTFKVLNESFESFSLYLTFATVFGEASLLLGFSLHPSHSQESKNCTVLVFVNCLTAESFGKARIHCTAAPKEEWFEMVSPSPQAHTSHYRHIRYVTALRVVPATNSRSNIIFNLFDVNGDVLVERNLNPNVSRHFSQQIIFDYCCPHFSMGPRLFSSRPSNNPAVVYSCDLNLKNRLSFVCPTNTTISALIPVPGLLIVHTNNGVLLLHPHTLAPVSIQGLQEDEKALHQFPALDSLCDVLKVWNIRISTPQLASIQPECVADVGKILLWNTISQEEAGELSQEYTLPQDLAGAFGSCSVGLAINNRLLILNVKDECVQCILDVQLPGKPIELHQMGTAGYIISTSNFVDHFREELYWLSVNGQLRGMLPCLGMGPRSFFSVTLPLGCKGGSNIEDGKDEHAHFLYFNDGQGAITCVHLG